MKKSSEGTFLDYLQPNEENVGNKKFKSIYMVYAFLEAVYRREATTNELLKEYEASDLISARDKRSFRKRALGKLKRIKNDISSTLDLLTDYSTFDSKVLLPFLAKYLSVTESEEYALMSDVTKCDEIDAEVFNAKPIKINGVTYYIITTSSNIERLQMLKNEPSFSLKSLKSIEDYLAFLDNDKYICIDKGKEYNLLNGVSLEKDFEKFPNLVRLGNALVNLKLSHPEFTDEEMFDIVLDNIKRVQKVTR